MKGEDLGLDVDRVGERLDGVGEEAKGGGSVEGDRQGLGGFEGWSGGFKDFGVALCCQTEFGGGMDVDLEGR